MPNPNPQLQSYIVNTPSMGGINTFDDPKDIADNESVDILNMVFDEGYVSPRQGSLLYANKPTGETAAPFQFLVPTNSNGLDFMIVNYGLNFYLWDTSNTQWIQLNQIYTPSTLGIYYGSTSWNDGISDDRFYFGNGTDDTMKWVMAISNLANEVIPTSTTLFLNDSTSFPTELEVGVAEISIASPAVVTFPNNHNLAIGDEITFQTTGALPTGITAGTIYYVIAAGFTTTTFEFSLAPAGAAVNTSGTQSGFQTVFTNNVPIILQGQAGPINLVYTSNVGNALTLTTEVGQFVTTNSTVTMPIIDMSNMPKGKVFAKFQNRLVLANSAIAENTLNYSYLGDPEDFSEDDTEDSGGFYTIFKGTGGIVNLDDFGEYLAIEKIDILLSFQFLYASDNSGFIVQVVPIMSGESIGPVSNANSVNYMNNLYYITQSEGIVSFSPTTTGNQTSSGLTVVSQKIQEYVTDILNFTNGRACGFNQKLFWLNSVPLIIGLPETINNGVIVYDLLRSVWTRFDNWQAADIKPINNTLYFISLNDGSVYEAFVDYQDAVGGNPYEYDASFTTKRFDFNTPQSLSRQVYLYVQGYISLTTTFYVDVLFNENGYLGKQTFEIDGSNSIIVQNALLGGLGAYPFGIPLLGGFNLDTMQSQTQPAFFRCYLELAEAFRPNNMQFKFYSQEIGAYWGINNYTLMYMEEPSIPTQLVISPTLNPPIVL